MNWVGLMIPSNILKGQVAPVGGSVMVAPKHYSHAVLIRSFLILKWLPLCNLRKEPGKQPFVIPHSRRGNNHRLEPSFSSFLNFITHQLETPPFPPA